MKNCRNSVWESFALRSLLRDVYGVNVNKSKKFVIKNYPLIGCQPGTLKHSSHEVCTSYDRRTGGNEICEIRQKKLTVVLTCHAVSSIHNSMLYLLQFSAFRMLRMPLVAHDFLSVFTSFHSCRFDSYRVTGSSSHLTVINRPSGEPRVPGSLACSAAVVLNRCQGVFRRPGFSPQPSILGGTMCFVRYGLRNNCRGICLLFLSRMLMIRIKWTRQVFVS